MQKNPGLINTGIDALDSTLSVLLSTTILVGGTIGCVLDNLLPGISILLFGIVSNSRLQLLNQYL